MVLLKILFFSPPPFFLHFVIFYVKFILSKKHRNDGRCQPTARSSGTAHLILHIFLNIPFFFNSSPDEDYMALGFEPITMIILAVWQAIPIRFLINSFLYVCPLIFFLFSHLNTRSVVDGYIGLLLSMTL